MTGRGDMWAEPSPRPTAWSSLATTMDWLVALDAVTTKLQHFYMGQLLTASPITFMADGKQYVTIASATDVFTFGLFEPAVSVPLVPESVAP